MAGQETGVWKKKQIFNQILLAVGEAHLHSLTCCGPRVRGCLTPRQQIRLGTATGQAGWAPSSQEASFK